jgi:cytochrome P450
MTDILPSEFFTDPGPSPHAATTELRSKCPVHRINIPPGAEAYAVLGNKVVEEAFGDPRLSKQVENLPAQYRDKATASSLLVVGNLGFADPPKHSRLKKPISKAFLPGTVARLRPRIQDIVDDLIDAFPESGEIDLLSAFALPLPLIAICEYLGIPVEDRPLFQEWSYVLSQDPLQHAESELKAASEEFADYFTKLVAERRNDLRDDLLSELIRARDEEVFSERELLSTILLLIIAGHKTVANMVGNGTTLLLLHPEQLATLRTTPELIPSAIEEILRYEGSAAWASLRVAAQDMRLGGVDIPKGSFVHLSLSGAGHDPEVYDDPERFDITRSPNRHLSFGHGAHFCIGAPLARLQGEIAFSTLLRRLPRFELAVPPEEIAWIADSSLSRGLEALPVRLDGRLPR